MSLERTPREHENLVNVASFKTADYQMTPYDYVIRVNASAAAVVITLPPVAEAAGKFYSVGVRDASVAFDVTLQDKDDSECWTDITFDAPCDGALLYSDGLRWWFM